MRKDKRNRGINDIEKTPCTMSKEPTKKLPCLRCQRMFITTIGIRICKKCKMRETNSKYTGAGQDACFPEKIYSIGTISGRK